MSIACQVGNDFTLTGYIGCANFKPGFNIGEASLLRCFVHFQQSAAAMRCSFGATNRSTTREHLFR